MIAFRYTKTDGAEYISHLDLLRHIYRTLRRAGIPLKYSEGFHKHPRIYLNNPLGTGIRSVAEYATVDTDWRGDFLSAFNSRSPAGIKCLAWAYVAENQNYAAGIVSCTYRAEGINDFDISSLMAAESLPVVDTRGREIDMRPRIYAVERVEGALEFTLGCGENNLRPDVLCTYLAERYGGECRDILKIASHTAEGLFE